VKAVVSAYTEATCNTNYIGLVKLMGRHCGFIALYAALAARHADIVLLPEMSIDVDKVLDRAALAKELYTAVPFKTTAAVFPVQTPDAGSAIPADLAAEVHAAWATLAKDVYTAVPSMTTLPASSSRPRMLTLRFLLNRLPSRMPPGQLSRRIRTTPCRRGNSCRLPRPDAEG
jgi:hypothetical protein